MGRAIFQPIIMLQGENLREHELGVLRRAIYSFMVEILSLNL